MENWNYQLQLIKIVWLIIFNWLILFNIRRGPILYHLLINVNNWVHNFDL